MAIMLQRHFVFETEINVFKHVVGIVSSLSLAENQTGCDADLGASSIFFIGEGDGFFRAQRKRLIVHKKRPLIFRGRFSAVFVDAQTTYFMNGAITTSDASNVSRKSFSITSGRVKASSSPIASSSLR